MVFDDGERRTVYGAALVVIDILLLDDDGEQFGDIAIVVGNSDDDCYRRC